MKPAEMRTVNGYHLDEVVSSLQKAIRRADEAGALYWSLELSESGFGAYAWRRFMTIAFEDVGLGDPQALLVTVAGWLATKESTKSFTKPPGMRTEALGVVVLTLCRAGKNREGDDAVWYASERRKRGWRLAVPDEALDWHTVRGRQMQRGLAFWFAEAARLENEVQIMGNRYGRLVRELLGSGEQEPSPSLEQGEP